MDYITAEQFLQQPEEVQKVLLDWWKPHHRELVQGCYYGEYYDSERIWCIGDIDMDYVKHELQPIPLFIETQLRHFIEEKTGGKFEVNFSIRHTYILCGYNKLDTLNFMDYDTDTDDLLQAYWQVACEIAREGINE